MYCEIAKVPCRSSYLSIRCLADLDQVISRAFQSGVEKVFFISDFLQRISSSCSDYCHGWYTSRNYSSIRIMFKIWFDRPSIVFTSLTRDFLENLYTTSGYHPTRCNEFNESNEKEVIDQMIELCRMNPSKIVAIGEFGLDYERTQFCEIEQQKR